MGSLVVDIERGSTSTNTSDGHAVADSMMKSLTDVVSQTRSGDPPTIYRVPQRIRQGNEDAYEPYIMSIGPYHNGKERLKGMKDDKWRYLHSFLSRNPHHQLKDYVKAIQELEDKARSCYSDDVGDKENEFVKMMVLDGCFIVELFLKFNDQIEKINKNNTQKDEDPNQKEEDILIDPIFSVIWILPVIRYDMLLLENQIPYLVLQRIFKMASPKNGSLEELALAFFDDIMPQYNKIKNVDCINHHLLHFFHSHLIPTSTPSDPTAKSGEPQLLTSSTPWMVPSAAELQLAGVKFRKKDDSSSILDLKFSNGVLEIPPLSVEDYTNTLFRNLVAFEQCYPGDGMNFFTTYVIFMDRLINTSKDVALLHRNKIMDHSLGSDEDVALLFNQLCSGICDDPEDNYLTDLYQGLEKHCNTDWNMWWASLMGDYFSNPWASLSSVAAVILLLLTITQTIFTIFPLSDFHSGS